MRVRTLLLLLTILVGAVVLWRFVISPFRISREAARLSTLLEEELQAHEVPRERTRLPGPAEAGDAIEHYLEAMNAFDELGYRVDFDEALLAETISDEAVAELNRCREVLELLSRGTRTSRVGHLWPARESQLGEDFCVRHHAFTLIRLLLLDARARFESGNKAGAIDRILESVVFAGDCGPTTRLDSRTMELLAELSADLPPADLDRAIDFITTDLASDPPVWEEWRWVYLNVQCACRDALEGRMDRRELYDHLGWNQPRLFGLYEGPPSDAEVLTAWERVRNYGAKLRAAAGSDDAARLSAAQAEIEGVLAGEPDEGAPHHALGEFYWGGEVGLGWYHTRRQNEMALLLALLLIRERHRTGSLPDDIESIRPEVIPKSPQGGTWRLGVDPETGRPAIYLTNADRWEVSEVGEPNVEQPLLSLR